MTAEFKEIAKQINENQTSVVITISGRLQIDLEENGQVRVKSPHALIINTSGLLNIKIYRPSDSQDQDRVPGYRMTDHGGTVGGSPKDNLTVNTTEVNQKITYLFVPRNFPVLVYGTTDVELTSRASSSNIQYLAQ